MDKRFRFFLSSTYDDLKDERRRVAEIVRGWGHFCSGMELFPASEKSIWDQIESEINMSDALILLIANRYGTTDDEGVSFTEREFDLAVSQDVNIPVYAILWDKDYPNPCKKGEQLEDDMQPKLETFRNKIIGNGGTASFYRDQADLHIKVNDALRKFTETPPDGGWVRANTSEILTEVRSLSTSLDAKCDELRHWQQKYEHLKKLKATGSQRMPVRCLMQGDWYAYEKRWRKEMWDTLHIAIDDILKDLGAIMVQGERQSASEVASGLGTRFRRHLAPDVSKDLGTEVKKISLSPDALEQIVIHFIDLGFLEETHPKPEQRIALTQSGSEAYRETVCIESANVETHPAAGEAGAETASDN